MYKSSIEDATKYLNEFVATRMNIEDFVIDNVEQLNNNAYNFHVKYVWRLNGWKKNVDTTVVVIYRPAAGDFLCSMAV